MKEGNAFFNRIRSVTKGCLLEMDTFVRYKEKEGDSPIYELTHQSGIKQKGKIMTFLIDASARYKVKGVNKASSKEIICPV